MNPSFIRSLKESGNHSYHRRAFFHDYFAPFIYHIILKKAVGSESFGIIDGDARIAPGNQGAAFVRESEIGKIIAKSLLHFPYNFPIIKLHQFCVMPDHVHILMQVLYRSDYHLDFYIAKLKSYIASKHSGQRGTDISEDDIFEPGYCDKPLYDNRSLDGLFRYIRENPHRLAMRLQFPQFFSRSRGIIIGDKNYEAYGNMFLLRNPDKAAVKISRSFTAKENSEKRAQWLLGATNGTVMVSPFISQEEKAIRAKVEAFGGRIILITHESFPELFKPAAHDFELCEQGRLLIISMGYQPKTELSRKICLEMNALAEAIAAIK